MGKKLVLSLLGLLLCLELVLAQNRTVKGTITLAEDGTPAVGASVIVKGTSIGVVTDLDGNFTLPGVPNNAKTLEISCIGMMTVEVPVQNVVNVALEADSELLDEAVVTIAYGAAKRSTLTGAISSVSAEKLENRPTSSVAQALEGAVTGIQVTGNYGAPGTDPTIRIRGIGTVNGSSTPLYVIDGVPFGGNLSDLNPADIESMTVLKDAASAALYGNRASNGVILITTKSAKGGRLNVTFDVKQGMYERGIKEYATATPQEYMEIEYMNLKNYRMSQGDDAATAAAYVQNNLIDERLFLNIFDKANNALFTADGKLVSDANIKNGYRNDINWFDQTIRKGHRQEYNLSASTSNERSDAFFSVGYLDEKGYLKNSAFKRFSGRASVNVRPTTYMKVGLNLFGTHQNSLNSSGVGDGSSSYVNPFMYSRQIAPIYPVHIHDVNTGEYILDEKGNKQYDPGYYTLANGTIVDTRNQYVDRHVIWENELNSDETVRNTLDGIAYVDFYFLKDFTFTVKGDLNLRNSDNSAYYSAVIGDGKGEEGRAKKSVTRYKNYTVQEQLRWNHQFGAHNVNVLLGHENYWYNYDYSYNFKKNQAFVGKGNLSNFTGTNAQDGYQVDYRTESYLGRVRYNYKDRYNVEASFRRDGSSRFAAQSRWGNFWSIGANWMISNEPFMENITWVNSLKLRADYGEVGNDAGAGYYGYMFLYRADEQNAGRGASYVTQLSNYDLKWETGQSWGVGLESRLFNRWNLNVEYFDKRNKDLLFDVYNPLSAGATSNGSAESVITKNLGVISNRGVEIETDVDIVRNSNFRLNIGGNATFLRNKVVTLPEQNKDGIISGSHKIVEGKDRYAYYLYQFAGVDQMNGQSLYYFNDKDYYITDDNTANGKVLYGTAIDEDGVANTLMGAANYTIINGVPYVWKTTYANRDFNGKSSLPKVYGSFNLSASWKGLSLSALFTYSMGGWTYDSVYSGLMSVGGTPSNLHSDLLKSWNGVPAGMTETSSNRIDPNGLPEVNYGTSSDNNAGTCDRWLIKSDYLVFKNVALSYQLPKNWAKAMQMQGVSISVACENVFSLTARQGMNPQQGISGGQSNYLVPARVLSAAVSFRF